MVLMRDLEIPTAAIFFLIMRFLQNGFTLVCSSCSGTTKVSLSSSIPTKWFLLRYFAHVQTPLSFLTWFHSYSVILPGCVASVQTPPSFIMWLLSLGSFLCPFITRKWIFSEVLESLSKQHWQIN